MTKFYSFLIYCFYRALVATWRITLIESDDFKKKLNTPGSLFVAAHWHGEELGVIHLLKRYHIACIVSTSKDGELMDGVIKLFGSKTSRGSSSKKSIQALLGIIRLAKAGWRPSVAVDGPKGPRHVVKPGVFEIAKSIDAPIFALSMCASNAFIFQKSWNKAELPLPFSKVCIVWSNELNIDLKDPKSEDCAIQLKSAIDNCKLLAKSHLNNTIAH